MASQNSTNSCKLDECSSRVAARQMCDKHYRRWKKTGDPHSGGMVRYESPLCSIEGCGKRRRGRGYCMMHYSRLMKTGDVGPVGRIPGVNTGLCKEANCPNDSKVRGRCSAHDARTRSGVPMDQPLRGPWAAAPCAYPGCPRQKDKKAGRGYCVAHYVRYTTGREMDAPLREIIVSDPENPDTWSAHLTSHGYVELICGVGGVRRVKMQHRWVMEQHLKRELHADETVHHVNGKRDDNRLENLELWSSRHPKGQRVEDKVEFALEMLRRYRPEALS